MPKLDYIKTILYGILLVILSVVVTLITSMMITKNPGLSIILSLAVSVLLFIIYCVMIVKIPEKIGFCTEENQKNWQIKLVLWLSTIFYVILSLGIYQMKSQIIGRRMLFFAPTFVLIGFAADFIVKKRKG